MRPNRRWAALAVAAVQLFDIAVHAASDQIEPIRVFANLILLAWALFLLSNPKPTLARRLGIAALLVFFLSNMVFLVQAGLTNPAKGGDFRLVLIVLVAISSLLTLIAVPRPKRVSL